MLGLACLKFCISDPEVEQSENFRTVDHIKPFHALPKERELKALSGMQNGR